MAYERCKTCDQWSNPDSHECPPLWECRVFEAKWENEWQEVYALDPEDAAEKFCEQYDCHSDYDIVKRGSEEIQVRKKGDPEVFMIDISAETRPHYYASAR